MDNNEKYSWLKKGSKKIGFEIYDDIYERGDKKIQDSMRRMTKVKPEKQKNKSLMQEELLKLEQKVVDEFYTTKTIKMQN